MARRFMDLDKIPGVRPVGIGEAICCLVAKLVQGITSHQDMEACRSNNICTGLKANIEGALHASERAFGIKTPTN